MKKFICSSIATAAILLTTCTPAFANVVRPATQPTGQPVAAVSNTGSAQSTVNRSATGTTNKFTHDSYISIY